MKIAFLLGSTTISGGTNVILEHASHLHKWGDEVYLLTEHAADSHELAWHTKASNLPLLSISEAKTESFDCAIATWWQSVPLLAQLSAASYIYFVQSIESRFFPRENDEAFATRDIGVIKEWIESTYRYPLPIITEASWIKKYLETRYNHRPKLVRNGIRKDIYTREGETKGPNETGRVRVLVEGPLGVFYKNVEKTIELCRAAEIDDIWLLTSSEMRSYPGVKKVFSQVPISETAEIYRSCDVLVKLSTVEGMFGPPLEMFHCGGTAVVYDVTGHDEYIVDGQNSLVVKQGDEAQVVTALQKLANDQGLLNRLKTGALETAAKWPDWDEAARAFSEAVQSLAAEEHHITQQLLEDHNNYYLANREHHFRAREMMRFSNRETMQKKVKKQNNNFVQIYWHTGQGFSNDLTRTCGFTINQWQECSVVLPSYDEPLKIRVDPSVRVGVVTIKRITLRDEKSGNSLKTWDKSAGFEGLRLAGTARLLGLKEGYTLFAYGEDPRIILPDTYLPENSALTVEIELLERGVGEWCAKVQGESGIYAAGKKIIKKAKTYLG